VVYVSAKKLVAGSRLDFTLSNSLLDEFLWMKKKVLVNLKGRFCQIVCAVASGAVQ
jgi:hypothetical protein